MAFQLRPYQIESIQAALEGRDRGLQRMLICLPTGAGKTVVFSEIARMSRRPVLVLAHRRELLDQAREKLERAGAAPAVVEQGERRAAPGARAVVASIRSLSDERIARLRAHYDFGWVVYDECHHAAAEDNQRVLRSLGAFDRGWDGSLLGFTATTQRGDGLGLDTVFEEIVYSRSIPEMIRDGYLVPLKGYRIATHTDLSRLKHGDGDFDPEALAEVVDVADRNALVARSIQELARDRRTVVFCVNVAHARRLASALRGVGIRARAIYGSMPQEDREQVLSDFRARRLAAVTNVGVLTEGFDDPEVSCVAMARPTKSSGLYTQCVGRGTRLFEGKTDCLVLDFVDLSGVELATLPSLFGLPWQMDLEGEDPEEAEREYRQIFQDFPAFEQPPDAITLSEIRARAEAFDPLTRHVDPELRAISGNAWGSLGSAGLYLHLERRRGRGAEFVVLDSGRRGKRRWRVYLDGEEVAGFSKVSAAVEAVDYEIHRMGLWALQSAMEDAPWREEPPGPALLDQLRRRRVQAPARTRDEALRRLAISRYGKKR